MSFDVFGQYSNQYTLIVILERNSDKLVYFTLKTTFYDLLHRLLNFLISITYSLTVSYPSLLNFNPWILVLTSDTWTQSGTKTDVVRVPGYVSCRSTPRESEVSFGMRDKSVIRTYIVKGESLLYSVVSFRSRDKTSSTGSVTCLYLCFVCLLIRFYPTRLSAIRALLIRHLF